MRKLDELSNEELKKVYEINGKLQEEVFEDFQEHIMDCVGDELMYFKPCLKDWSLGFCNRSQHMKFEDDNDIFLNCLEKAQKDICFLSDDYNEKIEVVRNKINQSHTLEMISEEWDNYEEEIEDLIKELHEAVFEQFDKMFDYELSDVKEYFTEFYAESRMDKSCYVNENYELFENIAYTKSYK